MRSIPSQELSAHERVTRDMLLHHCREEMTEIEHRFIELRTDQMLAPHSWLLRWPATSRSRSRARPIGTQPVLRRPDDARQASDRFRAGLAAGRTHARVNLEKSISMLDASLGLRSRPIRL